MVSSGFTVKTTCTLDSTLVKEMTALYWTPEGKLKGGGGGRPEISWRRTLGKEMKQMRKIWNSIQVMAKGR